MPFPAYHRDPRLRLLQTDVLDAGEDEHGAFVVLADTVLYPEGGGQPKDHGTVDDIEVLDVLKTETGFLHRLSKPADGARATVELDWGRRWDHMQQHTGQHLLSAIAEDRFGLTTTSFHLGEETADIELDHPDVDDELARELETVVAREIAAAREITTRWVEPDALPNTLRSRGLPTGHVGDVRLVEIDGLDCTTCGGTHLASTAEIGGLALLGIEPMRGGSRLYFAAGDRWRRRLVHDESTLARLRRVLECGGDEMEGLLVRRLAELQGLRKELVLEREAMARAVGESLAATPAGLVESHFDDRDAGFLQQVANAANRLDRSRLVFLTATCDGGYLFLISGSPTDDRISDLGPRVAELLGGRGGGRGGSFQGKGKELSRRDEAVRLLRDATGE